MAAEVREVAVEPDAPDAANTGGGQCAEAASARGREDDVRTTVDLLVGDPVAARLMEKVSGVASQHRDVGKSPSGAGREAVQEALDRRNAVSADQRDDVARVQAWSGLPLHQPAEVADEITRLAVVEDERGRVRRALHGPVDVERDEPGPR